MTSIQGDADVATASTSDPGVLLAGWIQQVTESLGAGDAPGTPGQALAAITALETLASAANGAQARLTVAYDTLTRAHEQANGITASRLGRTVASDIATARREPPYRGNCHLGLAKALLEMPNTAHALTTGQISEWKAQLLVKESAACSAFSA